MIAPPSRPPRPAEVERAPAVPIRAPTVIASFGYAFAGIRYLLWTQRNARIHSAVALAAVALGFLLGIERVEWLVIVLTIALVFGAEGFNTAIEAVVDLSSPGYHPLAKVAKDVAAGTVLLTAIAAVVVGVIVFLPRLSPLLRSVLGL